MIQKIQVNLDVLFEQNRFRYISVIDIKLDVYLKQIIERLLFEKG